MANTQFLTPISLGTIAQLITYGSGSPESVETAPVGSIYLDSSAVESSGVIYVKGSGTGTTGWSKLSSVSEITLTTDVTGTGTGTIATTIANNAVTFAKMQNIATASILGRNTGGTGNIEALSDSTTKTLLSLNNVENTALSTWAGTTNITTLGTIATGTWNATAIADNKIASNLTGKTYNDLTLTSQSVGFTIAGGTTSKTLTISLDATISGTNTGDQTITLTGDVTGSGSGSFSTTIANDSVTYDKMQNVSATDKVLGRSTAGSGNIEEISCTSAGRALIAGADSSAQRSSLGLVIGTDVQAWDSDLTTWAGLTPSAFFQTLVDDADASTARTTLGVAYGTSGTTVCVGNDSRLSDSRVPSGSAGGDLGGTYPNPTVTQARGLLETAGPTTLTMGAIANREILSRSGSTLLGFPFPNHRPIRITSFWDDVVSSNVLTNVTANGGAVSSSTAGNKGELGVLLVHAGSSSTTGQGAWASATNSMRYNSNTELSHVSASRIWVLNNGTNNFSAMCGFTSDLTTKTPAIGAFFLAEHGVNSLKWLAVCRNASTETTADTGISVDANNHEFVVTLNGTNAYFYIDGTLVATISTNVPADNSQMRYFVGSVGVAGTGGNRGWIVDGQGHVIIASSNTRYV